MVFYNEKSFVSFWTVVLAMVLFVVVNLGGFNDEFDEVRVDTTDNYIYMSGPDVSNNHTESIENRVPDDSVRVVDNSRNRRDTLSAAEYKESKRVELDTQEQIDEEIRLGEMELLALLVHAEAGNQDMKGKRLVADVVLNRVDAGIGDSVEDVIFMDNQFSVIKDGAFENAGWEISENDFEAAKMEYETTARLDNKILYFTAGGYNPSCTPAYKYGDHYFGY